MLWVLKDNPTRWFYQRLGGSPAASEVIALAGQPMEQLAYTWARSRSCSPRPRPLPRPDPRAGAGRRAPPAPLLLAAMNAPLAPAARHDRVLILDFGSQVTQLIARRLREAGVYCEIWPFNADPARDRAIRAARHHPVRRARPA